MNENGSQAFKIDSGTAAQRRKSQDPTGKHSRFNSAAVTKQQKFYHQA